MKARMTIKWLLLIGVVLACGSTVALAHVPSCNYGSLFCIWGHVYDATYPNQYNPVPICNTGACYGPVDLCYGWDTNCTSPLYTVCALHRDGSDNSAFYFYVPVSGDWVTKARTPWANRYQYTPDTHSYPAGTYPPGQIVAFLDADFYLWNGAAGGTASCP